MKISIEGARDSVCYAGLQKREFESIKHHIAESCRKMLLCSEVVAMVLLLGLTGLTYTNAGLQHNRMLYLITFLLVFAVFVVGETVQLRSLRSVGKFVRSGLKAGSLKHRHLGTVLPFSYLFLTIVYGFSIILGVYMQPANSAVTFCVLIFALPLLITDQPYRIDLFLLMVTVVFCWLSSEVKTPKMAQLDMVNSISFLFLSVFVNYFISKYKFNDIKLRMYIEKERDTDELTKLMTKAAFSRETDRYINCEDAKATLLIIDIDNFKQVNDTMGHAFGDAVLRIMGECIRSVFDDSILRGRFGGDEFVILMPGIVDKNIVETLLISLINEMDRNLKSKEDALSVTGSIGVAFMPTDAHDYNALFKKADEALYESKKNGKNCYTFYINRDIVNE